MEVMHCRCGIEYPVLEAPLHCPCGAIIHGRLIIGHDKIQPVPVNRRLVVDCCVHLGESTDESVICKGCGDPQYTLFECPLHGLCQPYLRKRHMKLADRDDFVLCTECDDFKKVGSNG